MTTVRTTHQFQEMQTQLLEELIIKGLTTQISANHTATAKLDIIPIMETSMNNFQRRLTTLEYTVKNLSIQDGWPQKTDPGGAAYV